MTNNGNGLSISGAMVLKSGMVIHDDGLFYVRRSTRRDIWRDVGKLILTIYALKIAIIAMVGIPATLAKITALESGMILERVLAFLLTPDPITVDIAGRMQWIIEAFSLVALG